jgi:hypothetical protein
MDVERDFIGYLLGSFLGEHYRHIITIRAMDASLQQGRKGVGVFP